MAEIYELILEDLLVAEDGLKLKSEQTAPTELFRATVGAAQLLLADIYLTLERYNEAQQKAQEVIGSGNTSWNRCY